MVLVKEDVVGRAVDWRALLACAGAVASTLLNIVVDVYASLVVCVAQIVVMCVAVGELKIGGMFNDRGRKDSSVIACELGRRRTRARLGRQEETKPSRLHSMS